MIAEDIQRAWDQKCFMVLTGVGMKYLPDLLYEHSSLSQKHKVCSSPKSQTSKHHFAIGSVWMLIATFFI